MAKETFIIAGLGNPGRQYEHTRHNAGFDTMAVISRRLGVQPGKKQLQGLTGEYVTPEKRVILCMPLTYMNLSGECLAALLRFYDVKPDHLLVIYDDIDLPLGRIRVRKNGSAGTHNGMRSIVSCLGTQDFPRVRVGTGAKPEGWDLADWVLSGYASAEDRALINEAFDTAASAALDWIDAGITHTMNIYNAAKPEKNENKE